MSALYLIRKGGAYYRPNSQGYTRLAEEAGRYTLEEAEAITHPNGPHGPRDGMDYVPDPATEKNPAAVETAGLEIAIQRQPLTGDAQESAKITTAAGAVEKAAPIPADVLALAERLRSMGQDIRSWGPAYRDRARADMLRAAALLADRASQEERIREDLERLEKAATEVSRLGAVTGPQWSRLSVALGRARARQRGDAS